ncbi:hypothetical protein [Streptomyces sp. NPDC049813]|uniref:hypothetical protein n=1 Tax=Streptomyces sp. NPDC049813 TaxID=3365597 RepID=UPI0037AC5EFA
MGDTESGVGEGVGRVGRDERRLRRLGRAGAALALIGLVLFALVPPAEAGNRAYAAAPLCPAGTRADDCRAVLPATVVGKDADHRGKSTEYYLSVRETGGFTGRAGPEHRVHLPDDELYHRVRVGGHVSVTYWKDEIRAVRADSGTQRAVLSPVHDGRLPAAFAVATLALGLGLLQLRWWMRRRPVPDGGTAPWGPVVGLVAAALVASTVLPVMLFAVDDVAQGLRFAAGAVVVAVPLSVLLGWWSTRRVRRGVARLVPVPPDGRRVLIAVVHGDVPYSRPGYGYLVVGDGPLTATPDPTGHVALAPLPATLTVRGVRAPVAGDPPVTLGGRGEYTVVIECADGDQEVRVLAGHRHAPRVLGALLAASGSRADYRPSV